MGKYTSRLMAGMITAVVLAQPLWAESHAKIIKSHGISAFGELKYPEGFAHFDYVNPKAPKGGVMSFRGTGASQTFNSLNYFILEGEPAQGLGHIYDTMLIRAWDEAEAYYGLLAQSIEYPEDRSWVIFNLRPEARFHDGEPVTAEDVVFTIETFKAEARPAFRFPLDDVETIEALSPTRVKATFAEGAQTRDLISEVGAMPILPKHYYQTQTFKESTMNFPLGSGPYVVSKADPGRSVTYCRDEDYWGKDLNVNQGVDNFGCYRYEYFTDRTAAFEALKAGAYYFHEEYSSASWATAYDFNSLDQGWVKREEISDNRPSGAQGFWFNTRIERFQDPRVREAIGMMFNFEWSNKSLFFGLYERVNSFWENSDLEATGLPSEGEIAILQPLVDQGLLDADILTAQPRMAPTSSSADRSLDRGNLRRASALLDDAGWIAGADGVRSKDGETLTVSFLQRSPAFDRIVNPIVENLQRLGVDAKLDRVDTSQYVDRTRTGDYDIVNHTFSMGLEPGIGLRQWYGSETASDSSRNLMRLRNPAVDTIMDSIIAASTLEDLATATHALDRVLRAETFWIPQWFKDVHTVAYYDMYRYPDPLPPLARGEMDFWWYDAEAAAALTAAGAFQ